MQIGDGVLIGFSDRISGVQSTRSEAWGTGRRSWHLAKGGPGELDKKAISRPADPLRGAQKECLEESSRGQEDRPWPPKTAVKDSLA